jgi:hypothetical protein
MVSHLGRAQPAAPVADGGVQRGGGLLSASRDAAGAERDCRSWQIAGDKDISIASASIAAQALDLGLVDEVIIGLVPVLLGKECPTSPTWPVHRTGATIRSSSPAAASPTCAMPYRIPETAPLSLNVSTINDQPQMSAIGGRAGVRKDCFDQNSASIGATATRSFTASASCRSSVIKASASSWVRATYSASNVSGHPSWSATFHAAF